MRARSIYTPVLMLTALDAIDERIAGLRVGADDYRTKPGKLFSRERILNTVWGSQEDPLTNVVDVYIGRLRQKLGTSGKNIHTARGLGYRFGKA